MTVVEQGNLAKAATRLSISRPVVSKSLSHLERTLGVRLLDRSPQGVELTAFGRALLKRSVVVFDELRQGVREIRFLADPTAGELRYRSLRVHGRRTRSSDHRPSVAHQSQPPVQAGIRPMPSNGCASGMSSSSSRACCRPSSTATWMPNRCSMRKCSLPPAHPTRGSGGAGSGLKTLFENHGFWLPRKSLRVRPLSRHFEPKDSRCLRQRCSDCPCRSATVCWPRGVF